VEVALHWLQITMESCCRSGALHKPTTDKDPAPAIGTVVPTLLKHHSTTMQYSLLVYTVACWPKSNLPTPQLVGTYLVSLEQNFAGRARRRH